MSPGRPAEPCSGLIFAFDTLWVPLCGDHPTLARVSPATNKITATLTFGPADDEGGITASEDSVWLASDKNGTLLRNYDLRPDQCEGTIVSSCFLRPVIVIGQR